MYIIDRPVPRNCSECPAYVRYDKAYDDPIGCIYRIKSASTRNKCRPDDCPIIEGDDDLK